MRNGLIRRSPDAFSETSAAVLCFLVVVGNCLSRTPLFELVYLFPVAAVVAVVAGCRREKKGEGCGVACLLLVLSLGLGLLSLMGIFVVGEFGNPPGWFWTNDGVLK